MPFESYGADESLRPGGGSVHIPEAQYLWEILGCSPSTEEHEGPAFFAFRLSAKDGHPDGIGAVLTHNCTTKMTAGTSRGGQFNLATIVDASGIMSMDQLTKLMGQAGTSWKSHAAAAKIFNDKGKGRQFAAMVQDHDYNQNTSSQIVVGSVVPPDGFVKQEAATPRASAPAARRNGPAKVAPVAGATGGDDDDLAAKFAAMLAEAENA